MAAVSMLLGVPVEDHRNVRVGRVSKVIVDCRRCAIIAIRVQTPAGEWEYPRSATRFNGERRTLSFL